MGQRHRSMAATAVLVLATACLCVVPASAATSGSRLWVALYDGPLHGFDSGQAVAAAPDGSTIFVTGISNGSAGDEMPTVAYDAATGDVRWSRRYSAPGGTDGIDVATSPDGASVYVAGATADLNDPFTFDFAVVAYNATTGAQRWAKRYDGPGHGFDYPRALALSPDGTEVYVTGASYSTISEDYATVAYDAATGARLWVARYDDAGRLDDAVGVTPLSDGSAVVVAGESQGPRSGLDYATVAYDPADGTQLWVRRYKGRAGGDDLATGIASSSDGSAVYVTGQSDGGVTSSFDFATVAYDAATGSTKWVQRFSSPGAGNDSAIAIDASPDGSRVFVTGLTLRDDFDATTVAYDAATGARAWSARFNGSTNTDDRGLAISVAPDGAAVYVAGFGTFDTNEDYITLAYNPATGAQQWMDRFDGPAHGDDNALSIASSADRVFVTGFAQHGTQDDFGTIAYQR